MIRRLETPSDYEAFENVMKEIWQSEDRDIIPFHLLKAINDQGGLVLGAFENGKMIGILVGFLAYHKGVLHHHSHMTGALQRYHGTGYHLKLAQRAFVLSQGLGLVTWTFDPLQSSNAYFNFAKLGVISRTYYREYYGEMTDSLNIGIPSDRFLVEWLIRSEDVVRRVEGTFHQPTIDEARSSADLVNVTRNPPFRENVSVNLDLTSERLLVEIPSDINALKEGDVEKACQWRTTTRAIFETYFSRGYTAVNVLSEIEEGERRTFYLLRRSHENSKG